MVFSLTNISAVILALAVVIRAEFFITSFSVKPNATTSLTWVTTDPDHDPVVVSVELQNPSFHNQFALGTTIPSTQNSLSISTPGLLPGPGYTLQIIATNNVSNILAETPAFEILPNAGAVSTSLSAGAPSTLSSSTSSSSTTSAGSASTTPNASTTPGGSSGAGPVSTPAPISQGSSSSAPAPSGSVAPANDNNSAAGLGVGLVPAAGTAVAVVAAIFTLFL